MATNPITAGKPQRGAKSPESPQECCDWANARMDTSEREWIVTGNKDRPIALFRSVWPKWRP
jgi:hypothetical protein